MVVLRVGVLVLLVLPALAREPATLRGTLRVAEDRAMLETPSGKTRLASSNQDLAGTLHDSRLSGRPVKLLGTYREDGVFDVGELYVERSGSLRRLIYFCEICNIVTFTPGICACCQQPVEPIEVLPTDPRIHYQDIPARRVP